VESKKILIIDDDELSYFSINLAARSEFFEVLPQAENSLKAIKAIEDNRPDVILMDVRLDSDLTIVDSSLFTDGIEFAHYLNSRYEIPIIFITAFSDLEMVSRSISKDFYGILSKPVDKVTLQTALLSALLRFQQDSEKRKQESMVNMFFDHNMFGYFLATYPRVTNVEPFDIYKLIEETTIIRVNETLLKLFDYTREELVSQPISTLFDFSQINLQPVLATLSERGIYEGKIKLMARNGKEFMADVHCKRVNYLEGNKQVLLGMIRDITEQVKAKEELEMLVPAVADIKESVIVTTAGLEKLDQKIIYVNKAACDITGYTKEELLGKSPRIFQGPLTDRKVLDDLKHNLKQGLPFQGRNINYRKDRSTYTVEWNITPVKNEDGEVEFFVSVQRDISKEVSLVERIERDKELLQAMLNNSRIAKILINENGDVLITNEFARIIIKKLHSRINSNSYLKTFNQLFPEKYQESFNTAIEKTRQYTFTKLEIEFQFNSQIRVFEFTCRKIGGSATVSDVQYLLTGFDITEIKRANMELKEMNKHLEDMVEERTKEYKLAKEEAIELSRVKDQFLANMSHEIRTPINGIRGMVHLLQDTLLNDIQREYLDTIKVSSDNLLIIINDILDIEKIKSGKINLEHNPFELNDISQNVQRLLAVKAKEKKISIYFDTSGVDQGLLVGDSARIQQVVLNLVENAIKFTSQGNVFIRIKSKKSTNTSNSDVQISVSDSGIGMNNEQLNKIFNPFVQADPSISRRFGGTGLGLSISKRLIELMNGSIQVLSEIGKGSEFIIDLSLPIWSGEIQKASHSKIEALDYSDYNLLLVDDNKVNLLFLKRLLDKWNCTSDSVESGMLAIDLLRNKKYDLVFLDIQMPEMDGYEVSSFVRNELKISSTDMPIIAITADVLSDQYLKMESSGMNGMITKPFDPKDIKHSIEEWIVKKSGKMAMSTNSTELAKGRLCFDELNDMADGDEEFKFSVLDQFHKVLVNTIETLPIAVESFDVKQIRMLVHRIKPNAGYFGLKEMVDFCKEIMTETAKLNFDKVAVLESLKKLSEYMILVEIEVRQELQEVTKTV